MPESLARIAAFALGAVAWGLAAEEAAAPPEILLVDPVVARVAESAEVEVRLISPTPVNVVALRLHTSPSLIALRSWSFGAGLAAHMAENGEPPICDIIVYPDGSGLFAVMAFAVPYESARYGESWLRLRYAVRADGPRASCLFLQSDSEDYEPGKIEQLHRLILSATRRCVPLMIRARQGFLRGDVDDNGARSLHDVTRLLCHLYVDGEPLPCLDAGDADDDGRLSIHDAMSMLQRLFVAGFPASGLWGCGPDPTEDALGSCGESSC